MTTNARVCAHWFNGGECGARDEVRRYTTGWRCAAHTPAVLAGRVAPVPDPAATLAGLRAAAGADPEASFTPPGLTLIDRRAVASGKRRAPAHEYLAARDAARPAR